MNPSPLRILGVVLGSFTLAACSPTNGGALDLCIASDNDTAEDGPSGAIIEREGLRLVPPEQRTTPVRGIDCAQLFELVADDGFHVWFGFEHEYGPDDALDDEEDIAPTLDIPTDALLRVRLDPTSDWSRGPSLLVEDERGILVAGQAGVPSGEEESFSGLVVEEGGTPRSFLSSCGKVTQHALTFTADTSALVEVSQASSIEAGEVELTVRNVQAMTLESNNSCTDTSSGTWRSWLAVRQGE